MSTVFKETVSDQRKILSGYFHSIMLNTLLLGIYTTLYFGTIYIYREIILPSFTIFLGGGSNRGISIVTSKSSRNRMVLVAITVLYLVNVVQEAVKWEHVNLAIGKDDTAETQNLLAEINSFSYNLIFIDITQSLSLSVADALLIWRCFKVWNNSLCVIGVPLLFFLTEIATYTTLVLLHIIPNSILTDNINNHLCSAGQFLTLGVTVGTTFLIAWRINFASKHGVLNRGQPRFYKVLEIILQSAIIYSVALVINALQQDIPRDQSNVWPLLTLDNYAGSILHTTTGIAPTLMVARVALASSYTSDTEPASISVFDNHAEEEDKENQGIAM